MKEDIQVLIKDPEQLKEVAEKEEALKVPEAEEGEEGEQEEDAEPEIDREQFGSVVEKLFSENGIPVNINKEKIQAKIDAVTTASKIKFNEFYTHYK